VLQKVYDRFTEGFEADALKGAAELIHSLEVSGPTAMSV
jgi:hypothetical protein